MNTNYKYGLTFQEILLNKGFLQKNGLNTYKLKLIIAQEIAVNQSH